MGYGILFIVCHVSIHVDFFIGCVCRTGIVHRFMSFKSIFSNHFAFTLGRYYFVLPIYGLVYLMWMLTIVIYI